MLRDITVHTFNFIFNDAFLSVLQIRNFLTRHVLQMKKAEEIYNVLVSTFFMTLVYLKKSLFTQFKRYVF